MTSNTHPTSAAPEDLVEQVPSRILVVDDDPRVIRVLGSILSPTAQVTFALDGPTAITMVHDQAPDLMLLDVEMPELDGLSVCTQLKEEGYDFPIIFLTGRDETAIEVAGLNAGAVDFITKPPIPELMIARVQTHLRLKHLTDLLRRSAHHDPLTDVYNRSQLDGALTDAWHSCVTEGQPLCLMMIDVDFFKEYNDHYGHPAGDEVLRAVASVISNESPSRAQTFRYGGDEFTLLCPAMNETEAQHTVQAMLTSMEESPIAHAYSQVADRITVSIGAAVMEPNTQKVAGASPQDLIDAADDVLLRVKKAGRHGGKVTLLSSASESEQ